MERERIKPALSVNTTARYSAWPFAGIEFVTRCPVSVCCKPELLTRLAHACSCFTVSHLNPLFNCLPHLQHQLSTWCGAPIVHFNPLSFCVRAVFVCVPLASALLERWMSQRRKNNSRRGDEGQRAQKSTRLSFFVIRSANRDRVTQLFIGTLEADATPPFSFSLLTLCRFDF